MSQYIIIPSCSDLNRGDQALTWETIKIAKNAGFNGQYNMLRSGTEPVQQSEKEGIKILNPILLHPSRKFKSTENIKYNITLILKWGTVALFDFLKSLLLLNKITRSFAKFFLTKDQKETLEKFEESDAIFVKGGGFLHSAGKITDSYKIYYFLFHIIFAQSLNKPVYVMPNSYGPFNGLGVAPLVRKVLKRCKIVTVRESISRKMLSEIGINAYSYPDLGFGLLKSDRQNNEIKNLRKLYPNRKLVGITARPYRFPGCPEPEKKYINYIENIVHFSRWLYEEGCLPVFIEHTLSETTHENDGSCIDEIVSKLNKNEYALIANKDYNCRDLKAIYSEFDYMVGTRFHSVIFALSEQVPSIAITYGGNKGQGIMRDLALQDYAISMSEFDAEKAKFTFRKLCENRAQVCSQLAQSKLKIEESYSQLTNKLKEK
jgi:colanic acid/amylovoran biosynthesis protein